MSGGLTVVWDFGGKVGFGGKFRFGGDGIFGGKLHAGGEDFMIEWK